MPVLAFSSYSPAMFDNLPSVATANCNFQAAGGRAQLELELATIAAKHPVAADRFGIQLLHRHSRIDGDEVMIAFGRLSLPIKKADIDPVKGDRIYAVSWGLDPKKSKDNDVAFVPLEFAYAEPGHSVGPTLDLEFAKDISAVLIAHDLADIIGIATISEDATPGLESTHGRANITLPGDAIKSKGKLIEVNWRLDPAGKTLKQCSQFCQEDDNGTHNNYGHFDSSTNNQSLVN
ncbi:hypothetical protein OC835_000926 [Tilletia horrida]|nr:hypothetical protein OC835_000926 [Tilletia horrida]